MPGKIDKSRKVLGRGLGNLLDSLPEDVRKDRNFLDVDIESIRANPDNPRKKFDHTSISELAETIRQHGLLQPILIRPVDKGYMIISGERRLRACRALGLKKVPCIIRHLDDEQNLQVALIENIQREQLDPVEEAQVYKELMEKYNYTQQDLSEKVGKNRATIANRVRLLNLPENILAALADGRVTEGQVRPLIGVKNAGVQNNIARSILSNGYNARQVEELVKKYQGKTDAETTKKPKIRKSEPADIKRMKQSIEERLSTHIDIKYNDKKKSGRILIDFYDLEHFERILKIFGIKK